VEEIAYYHVLEITYAETVPVTVFIRDFLYGNLVERIYFRLCGVVVEIIPKRAFHKSYLKAGESAYSHGQSVVQNFRVHLFFEVYAQSENILIFLAHEHGINLCGIVQLAPSFQ
jgi:hypothetical protein